MKTTLPRQVYYIYVLAAASCFTFSPAGWTSFFVAVPACLAEHQQTVTPAMKISVIVLMRQAVLPHNIITKAYLVQHFLESGGLKNIWF